MKSVKEATISGAKWGAIEKFSIQGIRFILGLIMARLLSPSDYGQVSMIMFFIVISDTLVDSGFNNALIRKKEQTQDDYSTAFYFNLIIAITCYVILWLIAPWVANFFNMPLLKSLLRLQSISVILNSLLAVQTAKLTIELNFKALAKCNLISSLISGILGVILAYWGFGVWSLVWQTLTACLINLICICSICRWMPLFRFSRQSFHSMYSYGSKLLVSNLINKVYQNLTTIIIGKFYSSKALGTYDRGASLASFPADNINMIMQKVTFPILARLQDDDERLLSVYRKYIKTLSLVLFFACIFFAAIAKPLIILLLGNKWTGAIIFMQIYTLSVCFSHIDSVNLNLLYVKGRSDLVLKLEIIKKSLSTIVLFASIPFGVVAICFAKVIYTQITIISDSYYTGKFYNYGIISQIHDVKRYFIYSLVACFPTFILTFSNLHNILILIFGIIISPLLYWLFLRKDSTAIDFIHILRESIRY